MDLWIEHHRPNTLDQIFGNEPIINRFKRMAVQGNIPHLLVAGPPGTGKTTSLWCLIREITKDYPNMIERIALELNASDERGIDVIRDRIQMFAKEKITLPPGIHKFVILDEADSLTEAAQQGLRHLMETHSDTTRFALTCNISSKIIEAVQSRCAIARFVRLTSDQILARLLQICDKESVNYTADGLEALCHTADGDLRSAINNLQATAMGFDIVNKENVYRVCSVPPPEAITTMLEFCAQGKWRESYALILKLIQLAYTVPDILSAIRSVLKSFPAPEPLVLQFFKITAQAHLITATGLDTQIQLQKTIAQMCKAAIMLKNSN